MFNNLSDEDKEYVLQKLYERSESARKNIKNIKNIIKFINDDIEKNKKKVSENESK